MNINRIMVSMYCVKNYFKNMIALNNIKKINVNYYNTLALKLNFILYLHFDWRKVNKMRDTEKLRIR